MTVHISVHLWRCSDTACSRERFPKETPRFVNLKYSTPSNKLMSVPRLVLQSGWIEHLEINPSRAWNPLKWKLWYLNGIDNYHTKDGPARILLIHLRRADLKRSQQLPQSNPDRLIKARKVENFMTLKQACSSEYQGAQGAFKDSMIHWILQFTLLIAFRCVLHRCESQEIRCWKLY